MDNDWFECTKIAAYYLWEYSGCDKALNLWYAAEDIACFFEQANILDSGMVDSIRGLGLGSEGYIWFVRNVSYRLYVYTGNGHELTNWYLVEQLINTPAWVENVSAMAAMLRSNHENIIKQLRLDAVRYFYEKQTL